MAAISFATQTPDASFSGLHPHAAASLSGVGAAGGMAAHGAAVALDESTALMYAAERGAVRSIQAWMARGGDINGTLIHQAGGSYTPLQLAAYTGHAIAVRSLLASGADPSATAATVTAPQQGGMFSGRGGAGSMAGPAHSSPVGHLPLHLTARYGHSAALEALLESGLDPNSIDEFSQTALHYATAFGHLPCVTALCRFGADVYATEAGARSASDLAVAAGHSTCATYLRRIMEAGGSAMMPAAAAQFGAGRLSAHGGAGAFGTAAGPGRLPGHSGYDYGPDASSMAAQEGAPYGGVSSPGYGQGGEAHSLSSQAGQAGPAGLATPSHGAAGAGIAQGGAGGGGGQPGVSFTMTGPGTVTLGLDQPGGAGGGAGQSGRTGPGVNLASPPRPLSSAGMGGGGGGASPGYMLGSGGPMGMGGGHSGGGGWDMPGYGGGGFTGMGGYPAQPLPMGPGYGFMGMSAGYGMGGMGMGMGGMGMGPGYGMGGMGGMGGPYGTLQQPGGMGTVGGQGYRFPGGNPFAPPPPSFPSIPPARARLRDWLLSVGMSEYYPSFLRQGYDDVDFIYTSGGLTDADCAALGIVLSGHRKKVCSAYGLKPFTNIGIMERHAGMMQMHMAATAQAQAAHMAMLGGTFGMGGGGGGPQPTAPAPPALPTAKGGKKKGKGKGEEEEEEKEEEEDGSDASGSDDGSDDDDSEGSDDEEDSDEEDEEGSDDEDGSDDSDEDSDDSDES